VADVEESTVDSDGLSFEIRPIRPSDEESVARFHRSLSTRSVHDRYFGDLALSQRIEHNRLAHICSPAAGDVVLVVEVTSPNGARDIVGVGRLSTSPGSTDGEVALIITDTFQNRGLGSELLRQLVEAAKGAHLTEVYACVLPGNLSMLRLCSNIGMSIPDFEIGGEVRAVLDLTKFEGASARSARGSPA
jgi:acetyltransferase